MTTTTGLSSLDEIIFQGRNKAYGAYQIRKNQDRNFAIAMLIVFASIGTAAGIHEIVKFFTPQKEVSEGGIISCPMVDVVMEDIELPMPKLKKSTPFVASGSGSSSAVRIVETTRNSTTFDPEAFQSDVENDQGITEGGDEFGTGDQNSVGNTAFLGEEEKPETMRIQVIEAAEFPGGEIELEKYIKTEFVFPEKQESEGILVMYFEVDENGKIKNVKVLQSFPQAAKYEAEAIRVLSNMPSWKPKKINGKPVPTRRELKINCKV